MDTRRKNDLVRRQKQGDVITASLRYVMGTPGIVDPGYVPNIHIRPQLWSGNARTGSLQINTGLVGLGRTSVRGGTEINETLIDPALHPLRSTKVATIPVHETRLLAPAWSARSIAPTREIQYGYRKFEIRPTVPFLPIHTRSAYIAQKQL